MEIKVGKDESSIRFLATMAAGTIKEFTFSLKHRRRNWKTKIAGRSEGKGVVYMRKCSHVSFFFPDNYGKIISYSVSTLE